mmetsp:Transcript_63788/g.201755  ORF Transcript_63788/g.201755 Transcript_63788/m.201755 type:complete len:216 (+) Transcript_63788:198-845(+)|eukprot:CAMPEP_0182864948 /NCGR_PEP_ID=MMETSP0034_2-20130328/7429_1 /TAXON_ID=156128 /ORGANISM="Nephroselmis pyriformis, Strain CCMP717" /LENGTH=215 /DNA_ID=CAMNT_0024997223 /DNA_START=198 /DNA_END=845 /DNA_ORIENTATION=-
MPKTTKVPKRALLVIDVQNDFCDGGALEVPQGSQVVGIINTFREKYNSKLDMVVISKDWHAADHCSFWSNHADARPFEVRKVGGVDQIMWNPHCIQGTKGAELHPGLKCQPSDVIVCKGTNVDVDSYSGFWDNNKGAKTEMEDILKKGGIEEVYVAGLAYDYCVGFTCLDAVECGLKTFLLKDAARGIAPSSMKQMDDKLEAAGVALVNTADVVL